MALVVTILVALLVATPPVQAAAEGAAATVVVNSTADRAIVGFAATTCDTGETVDADDPHAVGDVTDGDAECTLRAAVQFANELDGPDRIELPDGHYTLTEAGSDEDFGGTGDLDIIEDLTIAGSGASNVTVDAGGQGGLDDRVFHVLEAWDAEVTLEGITVTGGYLPTGDGAGLDLTDNTVVLDGVALTGNTAADARGGGVYGAAGSLLVVDHSEVSGNEAAAGGGAIATYGNVDLVGATLRDNVTRQGDGGAIEALGTVADAITIVDTTFRDNRADGGQSASGGAFDAGQIPTQIRGSTFVGNRAAGFAGAVQSFRGDLTVSDTTFSDNSAGHLGGALRVAGIDSDPGEATFEHVTVTGNFTDNRFAEFAEALHVEHTAVTLTNTLIVGNVADGPGGGPECGDVSTVTFAGGNVTTDGTCGDIDVDDVDDAGLLPLADNGGATPTHALSYDSAGIDAGVACAACADTDQRGADRPVPAHTGTAAASPDAGAFEYHPPVVTWDTAPADWTAGEGQQLTATVTNPADGTPHDPAGIPFAIVGPDGLTDADLVSVTEDGDRIDLVPVDSPIGPALIGRWGPAGGFVLHAGYDDALTFDVEFSEEAPAGDYVVILGLADLSGDPTDGAELAAAPVLARAEVDIDVAAATPTDPTDPDPTDPPARPAVLAACDDAPDAFPDDAGNVHAPAIDCLHVLGLLHGFEDGTVRPTQDVTRGQSASSLMRLIELVTGDDRADLCPSAEQPFADAGATHGEAIACLHALDIVDGFRDGTFGTGLTVTRAQTASLISRTARELSIDLPPGVLPPFEDVAADDTHAAAIAELAAGGVLEGYDGSRFGPTDTLTRGQIASVIHRLLALGDDQR